MTDTTTKGLGPFPDPDVNGFTGENYLFAIGIDKYEHWPPLKNAVRDVQKFVHILTNRYQFEKKAVTVIKDEKATAKNILSGMKKLVQKVTEEDNLVIYFSGHGHYDKVTKTGYWVPVDADEGEDNTYQFIRNADIRDLLIAIKSLHTLLIVDSCFSGSFLQQFRSGSTTVRPKAEGYQSRMVFTSGRAEQVVSDGLEGGNSPFARGLQIHLDRNTEKYISASKVLHDVKEFVTNETNEKQQPIVKRLPYPHDDEGEFVFCLRRSEGEIWRDVVNQHTIEAYKKFIEQFPKSEHLEEAQEAYDWLTAKKEKTTRILWAYLKKYRPNGKYVPQARKLLRTIEEERAWAKAERRNTISGYEEYLEGYPDGKYADEANRRIEELIEKRTWTEAKRKNTIWGYEEYLNEYPDGKHAKKAREIIKKLIENGGEGGNERGPEPPPADDIEKDWEKAKKAATYKTYREFMGAYPNSRFTNEAKQEMKQLDDIALNKIINSGLKRDLSVQKKIEQCITYFDNFPDAGNNKDVKKILNQLYKEMGERRGA